MNYLKHSLLDISKLIADAIAKGEVETHEYIYTSTFAKPYVKSIIYEKENVGVYIIEDWDWFGDEDDEYYDSFTALYAEGIPEKDLQTIEKTVKQMLSVRR